MSSDKNRMKHNHRLARRKSNILAALASLSVEARMKRRDISLEVATASVERERSELKRGLEKLEAVA